MSAIIDIKKLAAGLVAAEEKIARASDLEKQIRDAEERLVQLRGEEKALAATNAQARQDASARVEDAKREADGVRQAARSAASQHCLDAEEQASKILGEAQAECDHLADEATSLREEIGILETEESTLGQSVAALKAELEALRARVLG